jgi:hypothetical protein
MTAGTNTRYYKYEQDVCAAITEATPAQLEKWAELIARDGSVALVKELGEIIGIRYHPMALKFD